MCVFSLCGSQGESRVSKQDRPRHTFSEGARGPTYTRAASAPESKCLVPLILVLLKAAVGTRKIQAFKMQARLHAHCRQCTAECWGATPGRGRAGERGGNQERWSYPPSYCCGQLGTSASPGGVREQEFLHQLPSITDDGY